MTELYELTVHESASLIRSGEVSPIDLVGSMLNQIRRLEPLLKAWVYLDEDAVIKDAQLKEQEANSGSNLGRLHGVPIGLKDIYHNAPIPTTACSKVYANFVPDHDATTVSKLKQAGAIMLGKTVTTEFACADPSPTINPWNPDHTPGGSSSGSAVSVASRMCPAALGSQTVGSVLRPASYNGVVGFKPTLGRVSRYGDMTVSWSLDTVGPIALTADDCGTILETISVPDHLDSTTPFKRNTLLHFGLRDKVKLAVIKDNCLHADKDTMSKGSQGGPDPTRNKLNEWRQPVQINLWQDGSGKLNVTAADWVKTDQWNKMEAHNKEKASAKKWTKAQQMKKWSEDTRG